MGNDVQAFIRRYFIEIRILLENLLPLLGLWLFDWSATLILFFFLLDYIANGAVRLMEYRLILKDRKKKDQQGWIVHFILLICFGAVAFGATVFFWQTYNWQKDTGIAVMEGFIKAIDKDLWVIPLVGVLAYFTFLKEFKQQQIYRTLAATGFLKRTLGQNALQLGLFCGTAFFTLSTDLDKYTIVFLFVLVKVFLDYQRARARKKRVIHYLTTGRMKV